MATYYDNDRHRIDNDGHRNDGHKKMMATNHDNDGPRRLSQGHVTTKFLGVERL